MSIRLVGRASVVWGFERGSEAMAMMHHILALSCRAKNLSTHRGVLGDGVDAVPSAEVECGSSMLDRI